MRRPLGGMFVRVLHLNNEKTCRRGERQTLLLAAEADVSNAPHDICGVPSALNAFSPCTKAQEPSALAFQRIRFSGLTDKILWS